MEHTETTLEFTEPQHRRFSDRLKKLGVVHTSRLLRMQAENEPRSAIASLIVRKTPQEGDN